MRFATKTDLLARQPVVLRFTLPEGTRELLINGRVVMSFFDAKLASYAHGVAFTQYPPADRDEIARYVDGFEPASSESAALPPMKP